MDDIPKIASNLRVAGVLSVSKTSVARYSNSSLIHSLVRLLILTTKLLNLGRRSKQNLEMTIPSHSFVSTKNG